MATEPITEGRHVANPARPNSTDPRTHWRSVYRARAVRVEAVWGNLDDYEPRHRA